MCDSWVYLVLQNIPSATVLTLSNKVVLLMLYIYVKLKELSLSGNLENGKQTSVLMLDFASAFDKVNHSLTILLHKLHSYCVWGKISK